MDRGTPEYPDHLTRLSDPPDPLWVSGTLPEPGIPTLGVVGTRRCTPYGARTARDVAGALAAAGAVIVSGLAQGIDSTAHAAAIEAGGRTIAVLGEGLLAFDRTGPLARRRLAEAIRRSGAVVSEYALDHPARDWTFPKRNATIAALSDVLIVVEAPAGSGALVTTADALRLGRRVYCVPGPVGAPTWVGSNDLIAQGDATILTGVDQVARELGLEVRRAAPQRQGPAQRLLQLLADGPADTDTLAGSLGLSLDSAAQLIARELLQGTIYTTADGRFARR